MMRVATSYVVGVSLNARSTNKRAARTRERENATELKLPMRVHTKRSPARCTRVRVKAAQAGNARQNGSEFK